MATVTGPLLSATARGSFGRAMTFRMMNGKAFVGRNVHRPQVALTLKTANARVRVLITRTMWRRLQFNQAGWVYSYKDVRYYRMREFWELALANGEFAGPYPVARFAAGLLPWVGTFREQVFRDGDFLVATPIGQRAFNDFIQAPGIYNDFVRLHRYEEDYSSTDAIVSHLVGYPRMIPETIREHENEIAANPFEGWWTIAEPPGFTPPVPDADGKQQPAPSTAARLGAWRRGEKARLAKLIADLRVGK